MIHPHTYIHPNAKLATNVKVDPFSVIHQNVEIGEGTWIGSNVTIMEGSRIGKNCRIFPGAVIGAIPQDLKFEGESTTVEIGDNTTIREFVTINRGSKDRWTTKVGNNCLIMAYSHIAHDCIVGNNCIMSNNTQMAGHVIVGDFAILGGMCAVHQFVSNWSAFICKWWFTGEQRCAALYQIGPYTIKLRRCKFCWIKKKGIFAGQDQPDTRHLPHYL